MWNCALFKQSVEPYLPLSGFIHPDTQCKGKPKHYRDFCSSFEHFETRLQVHLCLCFFFLYCGRENESICTLDKFDFLTVPCEKLWLCFPSFKYNFNVQYLNVFAFFLFVLNWSPIPTPLSEIIYCLSREVCRILGQRENQFSVSANLI